MKKANISIKSINPPTKITVNIKTKTRTEHLKKEIIKQQTTPCVTKEVPTELSFKNPYPVDVSIIVPLYKSSQEIKDQIKSWDLNPGKYKWEIIYVNDACPANSFLSVIQSWKNYDIKHVGNIITNSTNQGYAYSCNAGAFYAKGEYLIFLNADTTVTPNWIEPIIDLLRNPAIGIVGNLQLKNNKIDSAGSEWFAQDHTFHHIGRNIYQQTKLKKCMELNNAPAELLTEQERDMVTGCCFGITKKLFDSINGFDINYKIGYWEDSDICMKVKERGYKIFYTPYSKIYHKGNHSKANHHPFLKNNRELFYYRWVKTKRIDQILGLGKSHLIKDYINFKIIGIGKKNIHLESMISEWHEDLSHLKQNDWILETTGLDFYYLDILWRMIELTQRYDALEMNYIKLFDRNNMYKNIKPKVRFYKWQGTQESTNNIISSTKCFKSKDYFFYDYSDLSNKSLEIEPFAGIVPKSLNI